MTASGGVLSRNALIGLSCYWKEKQIAYTSNLPDYVGCHYIKGAADGDTKWEIWKFSWTGVDCTRIEGPLTGSWTGRAALDWV